MYRGAQDPTQAEIRPGGSGGLRSDRERHRRLRGPPMGHEADMLGQTGSSRVVCRTALGRSSAGRDPARAPLAERGGRAMAKRDAEPVRRDRPECHLGALLVASSGLNGRTARMVMTRLVEINLPDFGMPDVRPEIPAQLYATRIGHLRERAEARRYDRIVVYADREHSASLSYLTGFDPRFEEALLVLGPTDKPAILAGNECRGMAAAGAL